MFEVTPWKKHTLPRGKLRPRRAEVRALLAEDRDFLRPLVQAALQGLLDAEMTEALGAGKGGASPRRLAGRPRPDAVDAARPFRALLEPPVRPVVSATLDAMKELHVARRALVKDGSPAATATTRTARR